MNKTSSFKSPYLGKSSGQKSAEYNQRDWAASVAAHARWKLRAESVYPTVKEFAEKQMTRLEERYPQLRK